MKGKYQVMLGAKHSTFVDTNAQDAIRKFIAEHELPAGTYRITVAVERRFEVDIDCASTVREVEHNDD